MRTFWLPLVLLGAFTATGQARGPTGLVLHAPATCKAWKVSVRPDEVSGVVSDLQGQRIRNVRLTLLALRVRDAGEPEVSDMVDHHRGGADGTFALFSGGRPRPNERVLVAVEADGFLPEHFFISTGTSGCVEVILAGAPDAGTP